MTTELELVAYGASSVLFLVAGIGLGAYLYSRGVVLGLRVAREPDSLVTQEPKEAPQAESE